MILSQTIKKAGRNRECWNCGCTIKKGDEYGNRLERYDGRLITFNYCLYEGCGDKAFLPHNQFNNFKKNK